MKIADIVKELELEVFSGKEGLDAEITGGYVSDLLSDVMGNAREGQVWISLQNHKNIVAVASLKDLSAVIIVKGCRPDADTMAKSNEEHLPLLGTALDTFTVSGRLFKLLEK